MRTFNVRWPRLDSEKSSQRSRHNSVRRSETYVGFHFAAQLSAISCCGIKFWTVVRYGCRAFVLLTFHGCRLRALPADFLCKLVLVPNCEILENVAKRVPHLRRKPAARYSHERHSGLIPQIRQSHVCWFEKPAWSSICICRVRRRPVSFRLWVVVFCFAWWLSSIFSEFEDCGSSRGFDGHLWRRQLAPRIVWSIWSFAAGCALGAFVRRLEHGRGFRGILCANDSVRSAVRFLLRPQFGRRLCAARRLAGIPTASTSV